MRYLLITEFLELDHALAIGREFPPWDDPSWYTFHNGPLEDGKQEGKGEIAGVLTDHIQAILGNGPMLDLLTIALRTGTRVFADPLRQGAGIHQCAPGGRLGMHIDFNVHPLEPTWLRVVNLILFVSEPGIGADDPGALILGTGPDSVRIAPAPGTLVAWRADDDIYHGHPEPMREDQPRRRSIPAYYYREARPGEVVEARNTRFL